MEMKKTVGKLANLSKKHVPLSSELNNACNALEQINNIEPKLNDLNRTSLVYHLEWLQGESSNNYSNLTLIIIWSLIKS